MSVNEVMVFVYSAKEDSVSFLSHNLTFSEAEKEVCRLRKKHSPLPAFLMSQKKEHKTSEAEGCRLCKREFLDKHKNLKNPRNPERSDENEGKVRMRTYRKR